MFSACFLAKKDQKHTERDQERANTGPKARRRRLKARGKRPKTRDKRSKPTVFGTKKWIDSNLSKVVEGAHSFAVVFSALRRRKKACINARQSSAKTSSIISIRWLSTSVSHNRNLETTPPNRSSRAPNTSREIRAFTKAPAHITHGSMVV